MKIITLQIMVIVDGQKPNTRTVEDRIRKAVVPQFPDVQVILGKANCHTFRRTPMDNARRAVRTASKHVGQALEALKITPEEEAS